jgi:hypothetical protein
MSSIGVMRSRLDARRDLHRAAAAEVVLEEVLCVQEERVVGNDWCVRWRNRWLQIGFEHATLRLPGRRVRVKQLADLRLLVQYQGQRLNATELRSRPAAVKAKQPIVNNRRWKPDANHPWNRPAAERRGEEEGRVTVLLELRG